MITEKLEIYKTSNKVYLSFQCTIFVSILFQTSCSPSAAICYGLLCGLAFKSRFRSNSARAQDFRNGLRELRAGFFLFLEIRKFFYKTGYFEF